MNLIHVIIILFHFSLWSSKDFLSLLVISLIYLSLNYGNKMSINGLFGGAGCKTACLTLKVIFSLQIQNCISSICMTFFTLCQWITVYSCSRALFLMLLVWCLWPVIFSLLCVFFHLQSNKMLWLHPASLRFFSVLLFYLSNLNFFTYPPSSFQLSCS